MPMDAAEDVAQTVSLGERLVQARERRGLALAQAAEKLRLEPKVVEALEAERFEELGAAVYVRGYLQHYAELLGENPAELLELYASRASVNAAPDLTQIMKERHREAPRGRRFGVWQGALLTLALILVAVVWWAVRSGPVDQDLMVESAPITETPPAAAPAPVGVTPPAVEAGARTATGPVQLQLQFRQDCWVEVYDAAGATLHHDMARAGTTETLSGTPPLRLVLGNAGGVGIRLDGHEVILGAHLPAAQVIRFTLERDGQITRESMN